MLPGREELLDYVEQAAGQDVEVQKQILRLLGSSPLLREHLAELKRDLYLVSAQVPDYSPDAAFGAEIMRLSQVWTQSVYARKFSLKSFYRSREFFGLVIALVGATLVVLALMGAHLLSR